MTYKCLHCSRTFATPYALKRHISDKHQYIAEDEGETSRSNIPYDELSLWDEDLPTEEPSFWDEDFSTEDQMVRS
jgi:Zinc finger, C2H2 type